MYAQIAAARRRVECGVIGTSHWLLMMGSCLIMQSETSWFPLSCPAGLDGGADSVKEFLQKARYLVLGLGDVYLGCAIATAIDPRYTS